MYSWCTYALMVIHSHGLSYICPCLPCTIPQHATWKIFSPGIMGFLESMIDDNGLHFFSAFCDCLILRPSAFLSLFMHTATLTARKYIGNEFPLQISSKSPTVWRDFNHLIRSRTIGQKDVIIPPHIPPAPPSPLFSQDWTFPNRGLFY